jgi:hypothetical protein
MEVNNGDDRGEDRANGDKKNGAQKHTVLTMTSLSTIVKETSINNTY